jgi:chemotaxis protein methyltransferase CheR
MSTSPALPNPQSPVAKAQASPLSAQSYSFLQHYILRHSGIVLDESKRYLVEARLLPIIRTENIISLDSLCQRMAANTSPALNQQVIEAMTTNETLFFRDPGMFDALKASVLPSLLASLKGKRKLRIWSAASSTGQEAYSLAMVLLELGVSGKDVEIVGTDLAENVLEKARKGRYVQFEVSRGLPMKYLASYFTKTGMDWQLSKDVLGMVRFQQMDLRGSLRAMGECDLVLCRNVLIYFNIETKRSILGSIRQTMAPGALLVLGCAETVIGIDDSFERKVFGSATFYGVRDASATGANRAA